VAHRGWWRSPNLVENSFTAFAIAVTAGFPAECDVWPSADGEPVVIHDETLDRTTVGHGNVSANAADRFKTIRLREPEPEAWVPLLSEVSNLVSYVEVKAPDSPAFVRRVTEIMGPKGWLLQSFDERTLEYAQDLNPQLPVAFLVDEPKGFDLALGRGWAVHADHRVLDRATVTRFRDRDLRIGAWTVNTESDIRRLIPWELDVIISDEPKLVKQLIEAKRPEPATNRKNSDT
jgi:glycerophosphoryl diester phosphodiesterase